MLHDKSKLPQISPNKVLGSESSRVSPGLLKKIGRTAFERAPKFQQREQAAYDNLVKNVSAFTSYWDEFLQQRGDNLSSGLAGVAKLRNGVEITFKGETYDHSQGSVGGRGANWDFDVQPISGRALHVRLATENYRKGEKSEGRVAARDISQMRDLVFSESETGHPISSYPPKERLEGYGMVCEVMDFIESAHQAGDVELLK